MPWRLQWLCRPRNTLRSEEHTSELQSRGQLVCRLLLEKKKHDSSGSEPRTADGRRESFLLLSARTAYALRCSGTTFFLNGPATTEIYTLSLHDALPIYHDDLGYLSDVPFLYLGLAI